MEGQDFIMQRKDLSIGYTVPRITIIRLQSSVDMSPKREGYSFFFNFYCYSITVVCLFSRSLHSTPAEPTTLPHLYPPPWFVSFIVVPVIPSSHCLPPRPALAIVRLFLTSMSLVTFCFLFSSIDYVPVKGEIIWYFSLTTWLISVSILLSSFIHAIAKGISSFFLSAA